MARGLGVRSRKLSNVRKGPCSEDTLSDCSRLHLQSLAPSPVSRRVHVRQAAEPLE
jgi:hypothetical protein